MTYALRISRGLLWGVGLAAIIFLGSFAHAQTATGTDDSLEGIEVEVPDETPSPWALFVRGLRERLSEWTTFDPTAKAEKQLQFAEERQAIAEKILAESTDDEERARAERMLEWANRYMEKIDARKDKWIEKRDERSERLMRNIAKHELRRGQLFDRIEEKLDEKLPEEKIERLRTLQERGSEVNKRLLNALENENISEAVREHLEAVKARIEAHAEAVSSFREKRQELLEAAKAGDASATATLKNLWEERKERLGEIRETFQEKQETFREELKEEMLERKEERQARRATSTATSIEDTN